MKKKNWILIILLLVSALLAAGFGAYLKFQVLRPLNLFQDENILKVPFLLLADDGARYALAQHMEQEKETQVSTETPSETVPPVILPSVPEVSQNTETETTPETVAQTTPATTPETVPATTPETVPETAPATTSETTAGTMPETTPESVPETTPESVPETEPVVIDETWFDDALFVGDSRTVGMRDIARLGKADYFCDVGMTVFKVLDYHLYIKGSGKVNLARALEKKEYGKVFIHLGLNECSSNHDLVMKKFQEIVDLIQEKRPDAEIYIQSVMVVAEFKSRDPRFTTEDISDLNARLKALTEEEEIHFIDTNAWAADENGFLRDDIRAGDGAHLCADGYRAWAAAILEQIQEMYS